MTKIKERKIRIRILVVIYVIEMSKEQLTQRILDHTFKMEGGVSDNKQDFGGYTKYGITQGTLSNYLGRHATRQEVFNLTKSTAEKIYRLTCIYRCFGVIYQTS